MKTGIFKSYPRIRYFTFTFNSERNWNLFFYNSSWGGITLTDCDIMIVKGTTVPETFQEYNGPIIHEKDITPVLLWKNGNPNAEFTEQTITLSESLNNYEYINILYKQVGSVDSEPVIYKIKNLKKYGTNYSSTLSWCGGTTTQSTNTRAMTIPTNTSIKFGAGYRNNSILNTIIVPYAIYGSNY